MKIIIFVIYFNNIKLTWNYNIIIVSCSGESTRLPPMGQGSSPGINGKCGLSVLSILPFPQKLTFPNSKFQEW